MSDIFPFCFRNSSMQNTLKSALKNRKMFSFCLSLNFSWAVRSVKAVAKVIKTKKPHPKPELGYWKSKSVKGVICWQAFQKEES